MKKVLLIAFLSIACSQVFANLQQGAWRWRSDDGSETSATWIADENTAPIITSMNNLRLRMEIYNDDADPFDFNNNILEDSVAGSGVWTPITSTSTTNAFMLAGSSPFVSDMEATTNQLVGMSTNPFKPGLVLVSSDTYSYSLPITTKTEFEWVLKPTGNLQPNTVYYFRLSGSVDYPGTIISLITGGSLPITLSSFNVAPDGNRVKIAWSTASEQNNDRFEILRSSDGKNNWKVVATQKGSGTTTQSHSYTAYDNSPLNGNNYYRIKQYDFDGKAKETEVKFVSMKLLKAIASVYPNPVREALNFTLNNYKGNVTAMLVDMKGGVAHKEVVAVTGEGSYRLNLKNKPAPAHIYYS